MSENQQEGRPQAEQNAQRQAEDLIIDCDHCAVRPHACGSCVVSVLLGAPPTVEWDDAERRAVTALADGGMLPRLRLVPAPRTGRQAG